MWSPVSSVNSRLTSLLSLCEQIQKEQVALAVQLAEVAADVDKIMAAVVPGPPASFRIVLETIP